MKSISDYLKIDQTVRKLTQNEHQQVVQFFYENLNEERRRRSFLNFRKFWARNNHLNKEEAIRQFQKTKGKDGCQKKLSGAFISMAVSGAKLTLEDLWWIEKRSKTTELTALFPWPKYTKAN